MKKITDNKTGETFMGEFWIAEVKDGVRTLKVELADETELDRYDVEDVPEEKPFWEVAEIKFECIAPWTSPVVEKIQIADQDYYEMLPDGTKKTEFTWDEAMEIEKKTHGKWRVPTQSEWFAIVAAFGADKDGKATGETLAKNLNLTTDKNDCGFFWSSNVVSSIYACYLSFYATAVNPQHYGDKAYGFTVRCVAR